MYVALSSNRHPSSLLWSFNTVLGIDKERRGYRGAADGGQWELQCCRNKVRILFSICLFYVMRVALSSDCYPFSLLQHSVRCQQREEVMGELWMAGSRNYNAIFLNKMRSVLYYLHVLTLLFYHEASLYNIRPHFLVC